MGVFMVRKKVQMKVGIQPDTNEGYSTDANLEKQLLKDRIKELDDDYIQTVKRLKEFANNAFNLYGSNHKLRDPRESKNLI